MSFKKSKLDLLVRVRYTNPLPPPPYPPKLLNIPTDPLRYARPEFTNALANETLLPMIVDAECGMPLDLGRWESLWEDGADDYALNPDRNNLPILDPKDEALLGDIVHAPHTNGHAAGYGSGASAPTPPLAHVTWLRRTEYISREHVQRASSSQETKHLAKAPIDVSRPAQINDILASFSAADSLDLSKLKHPNKPEVTAVDSYEIFPDDDIWANAYDLFRFSERPGERPVEVDDPRLDCAILRPMESDGDHFLAYYLIRDDEVANHFKRTRNEIPAQNDAESDVKPEHTVFKFVRDYETVKVEQEVPNEFLLVFDNGDEEPTANGYGGRRSSPRPKAAYYKNIERKMLLKKKRTNRDDDRWDDIKVTRVRPSKEEEEERQEALAEVADPMFMISRAEADADGELDDAVPVTEGTSATLPPSINGAVGSVEVKDET